MFTRFECVCCSGDDGVMVASMGKENPKRQRASKRPNSILDPSIRTGTIWYSFFLQSS